MNIRNGSGLGNGKWERKVLISSSILSGIGACMFLWYYRSFTCFFSIIILCWDYRLHLKILSLLWGYGEANGLA
jgi:hypothetical protein